MHSRAGDSKAVATPPVPQTGHDYNRVKPDTFFLSCFFFFSSGIFAPVLLLRRRLLRLRFVHFARPIDRLSKRESDFPNVNQLATG
uniref:Uncharacterized protein n=1 Tax=Oryza brachyantha TaxID=4533 RepID=J3MF93_ORYBR